MDTTMKITILIVLLALSANICTGQGVSGLEVHDTRNVNSGPIDYSKEVRFDFKKRSVIGVPGTGTYFTNFTIAPWASDGSGNKDHQFIFNDGGVYYRSGTNDSSIWGSWKSNITRMQPSNKGPSRCDNIQNFLNIAATNLASNEKSCITFLDFTSDRLHKIRTNLHSLF